VITDETVITDEMIAIAETIDTMIGMGTTTATKSREIKATAMVYRLAHLMPSITGASIRNDLTSGRTAMTATARVMETEVSSNRSFVTRLCRATVKAISATVATTTDAVTTTDDGVMAGFHGPGKYLISKEDADAATTKEGRGFRIFDRKNWKSSPITLCLPYGEERN
jgi:hypothetical protein